MLLVQLKVNQLTLLLCFSLSKVYAKFWSWAVLNRSTIVDGYIFFTDKNYTVYASGKILYPGFKVYATVKNKLYTNFIRKGDEYLTRNYFDKKQTRIQH